MEHASDEAIISALKHVVTPSSVIQSSEIPRSLLVEYGLIAGPSAKSRREALGDDLRIGYTNGKQLVKRLGMFQISREQFEMSMEKILAEEKHELSRNRDS